MPKKILAIYYSQSGQLKEMISNFCKPFLDDGNIVESVQINLKKEYPFPWTSQQFFNIMPDCVMGKSAELLPVTLQASKYDLIVLGYQPWFLSPSIPFNSLMQQNWMREIIRNTPVITITGARNMWVTAFKRVKVALNECGAKHVATVAMVDRHLNLVSIFTIFHWMLHGTKSRYLGFFPKPGVADEDIARTEQFGTIALTYLKNAEWEGLNAKLIACGAVVPKFHLMLMESKAAIMFKLWARFIDKTRHRKIALLAFKYYLLTALFLFAPIVFVIDLLLFKPFLPKYVKVQKQSCLQLY